MISPYPKLHTPFETPSKAPLGPVALGTADARRGTGWLQARGGWGSCRLHRTRLSAGE